MDLLLKFYCNRFISNLKIIIRLSDSNNEYVLNTSLCLHAHATLTLASIVWLICIATWRIDAQCKTRIVLLERPTLAFIGRIGAQIVVVVSSVSFARFSPSTSSTISIRMYTTLSRHWMSRQHTKRSIVRGAVASESHWIWKCEWVFESL